MESAYLSRNACEMKLGSWTKNTRTSHTRTAFYLKIIWSQSLNILLEHKARIYILALADLGTMPRKTNMFSLITPQGKEVQLEINIVGLKMQSKAGFLSGGSLHMHCALMQIKKDKNK